METHFFFNGINLNYTKWIFHGEKEIHSFNDVDDDVKVSDKNEFVYDILDDIRAGTFVDAISLNPNPTSKPPIPESTTMTSF